MAVVAAASVVVPAHNESGVIGRCLESLLAQGRLDDVEVVVVANGCSDDTAERAREYAGRIPGLRVIELEEAGKVGALNAGDRACTTYPRIFLDADIVLEDGALPPLIDALTTTEPLVGAPRVSFRTETSTRSVKAFYGVFEELPYARNDLVGLGVYGFSEAGRRRFGAFPAVIADDLFVQRLFAPEQRVVTEGAFHVFVPRNLRSLVAVRTRVARGNSELAHLEDDESGADLGASTRETLVALARLLLAEPSRVGPVLLYVFVTLRARQRARSTTVPWPRDTTSRPTSSAHPTIVVDGVPINPMTEDQVVDHVLGELEQGRGGLIVTPNTDIMRQLRRGYDDVRAAASLTVADGMPVVWASRVQGTPLPARVTGADLVWSLSRAAGRRSLRVFLLGAGPGVAERAGAALVEASEGLVVAGSLSPDLGFDARPESLAAVIDTVASTRPDLVYVALGFPRQERVAIALRERLPATWMLGCGGALDMAAGDTERAPERWQRWGGEWVHRLRLQPRRLAKRYLVDDLPYAAGLFARSALHRVSNK